MASRRLVRTKSFDGEMVLNQRDGFGTYQYSNSYFTYTGNWSGHKKHGYGILVMADGGSFEGTFENGEINGQGVRRWPDGTTYTGGFLLGEMHGHGTSLSVTGEVYQGDYLENFRHGQGSVRYRDGSTYCGEWLKSKFHGQGMWVRKEPSHVTYHGEFADGLPHGETNYTNHSNGDTFLGVMSKGQPLRGKMFTASTGITDDYQLPRTYANCVLLTGVSPGERAFLLEPYQVSNGAIRCGVSSTMNLEVSLAVRTNRPALAPPALPPAPLAPPPKGAKVAAKVKEPIEEPLTPRKKFKWEAFDRESGRKFALSLVSVGAELLLDGGEEKSPPFLKCESVCGQGGVVTFTFRPDESNMKAGDYEVVIQDLSKGLGTNKLEPLRLPFNVYV